MKNNIIYNKFRWFYLLAFSIILALPALNLPPWFFPPDFVKAIVFRSILAIMLFVIFWQILNKKGENSNGSDRFEPLNNNKKSPILWSMAGLFGVFLLASIFSVDPYFSFWASPYRGGGFITFAFCFVFAVLAFLLLKKDDWKKAWIFSNCVGIIVSIVALIQFYGFFNNIFISVGSRPGSTIGNPIFLGIYLLLLFFPTLTFLIKEKNKQLRLFYIFSFLIFLYVIFIAGSRATYLGIMAGALCFFLFYPIKKSNQQTSFDLTRKAKFIKITVTVLLIFALLLIIYINTQSVFPQALHENRLFSLLEGRLSIKKAFSDERYRAWQTVAEEVKDKPLLGWGPENLAVGFDKNYDPNVTWSPWWDKAHNIFLDIGAQAGILGILAYILLFVALFWQLQKTRKNTEDENKKIIINGVQATLAAYLVANFFSFDSFPTYLLFFFIIAYSLHLTCEDVNIEEKQFSDKKIPFKNTIISVLFVILVVFLWQYNLIPFQINTQINIAKNFANQKKCNQSFTVADKLLKNRSFMDSYLRMEYVNNIKKCGGYYPENDLAYTKKGIGLLKEAVKIQPLYTRYWIYLGSFTTIIADNEQDPQTKSNLIKEAYSYFDKAESLSPLHTEILIEKTKTDIANEDYQKMKQDAEKCISIKPKGGECYWAKALSELYMQNYSQAYQYIDTAKNLGFRTDTTTFLYQLVDVYNKTEQYGKLADVYEKLISSDPSIAQYHASLAFTYAKLGEYKKAKSEAEAFLKLVPEAKDEVDAFLKTLPY